MPRRNRKGVAVVEFAIILPFFIILVLGMLECGARLLVKQKATQAAQAGARYAATPDSTDREAYEVTQEAFWGVEDYEDIPVDDREKVSINILIPELVGDPTVVLVHCDFKDFAPFPPFIKLPVDARCTYRKEG